MTQTREERAAYMREYGKRRIRTTEQRRAERERGIESERRRYAEWKNGPKYAKRILAQELGVLSSDVPDELARARFQQIELHRLIRAKQETDLYDKIVKDYLGGETSYTIAEKYGFDRSRVTKILKERGVSIKRRPHCAHGHAMTDENTAFNSKGYRRCRKCACRRSMEHYRKKNPK